MKGNELIREARRQGRSARLHASWTQLGLARTYSGTVVRMCGSFASVEDLLSKLDSSATTETFETDVLTAARTYLGVGQGSGSTPFVDWEEWAREVGAESLLDHSLESLLYNGVSRNLWRITARELLFGAQHVPADVRAEVFPAVKDCLALWGGLLRRGAQEEADSGFREIKPSHPNLEGKYGALLAVRSSLRRTTRPWPRDHVVIRKVEFRDVPARVFSCSVKIHHRPYDVAIWLEDRLDMTCRCWSQGGCDHTLAAIDYLLRSMLGQGDEKLRSQLEAGLGQETWIRVLTHLEAIEPETVNETQARSLAFEIGKTSAGIKIHPHEVSDIKGRKTGKRVPVSFADLAAAPSAWSLPEERRFAELCGFATSAPRAQIPKGATVIQMLDAISTHPRVSVLGDPERQLRIARAEASLRIERVRSGYEIVPAFGPRGDHILPSTLDTETEYHLSLDEAQCVLWMVLVPQPIRYALRVLTNTKCVVPESALPALLERLPALSQRYALDLSRVGELKTLDVAMTPLYRLTLEGTNRNPVLKVEIRVKVHPQAPSHAPGTGAHEVLAAIDGSVCRFLRDRASEPAVVARAASAVDLAAPHWTRSVTDIEEILELLHRIDDSGVEVEWGKGRLRSRRLRASGLRLHIKDARDWFGIEGGIEVDGKRIELAVLLEAARDGQRFIPVGPEDYVRMEDELLELLMQIDPYVAKHRNELRMMASGAEDILALSEQGHAIAIAERMRELVEKRRAARNLVPRLPEGLRADLREYQKDGHAWLHRLQAMDVGGILADDMGLGKTVQALSVLLDRKELGPALVVAPTSVCFNWTREVERFTPGLVAKRYVGPSRGDVLSTLVPGDILIVSYGLLTRDAETFAKMRFSSLVLDEAHAVKNPDTQRARAVASVQSPFRLALTGTPLENHLGELWALMSVVEPTVLGSLQRFRERWVLPAERAKVNPILEPIARRRSAELSKVIQPYLLRRKKADVAKELPPKTEMQLDVPLAAAHRRIYEDVRLASVARLAGNLGNAGQARMHILAALTRLRLAACHPRLVDEQAPAESSKVEALVELLLALTEEGQKTLVFSQFTSLLDLVELELAKAQLTYVRLDGATPEQDRAIRVDEFQKGSVPIFLLSLKAGGVGLNLDAAENVVHLDPWWNPAVEDQATDRAHRIGQTKPVTVYRLVAQNTIESTILGMHREKRNLVSSVLEGTEKVGGVSTEELIQMIEAAPKGLDFGDEEA